VTVLDGVMVAPVAVAAVPVLVAVAATVPVPNVAVTLGVSVTFVAVAAGTLVKVCVGGWVGRAVFVGGIDSVGIASSVCWLEICTLAFEVASACALEAEPPSAEQPDNASVAIRTPSTSRFIGTSYCCAITSMN
jgi:hypothetical protein